MLCWQDSGWQGHLILDDGAGQQEHVVHLAQPGAVASNPSNLPQFADVDVYVGVLAFSIHLGMRYPLHGEPRFKQLLEARVDAVGPELIADNDCRRHKIAFQVERGHDKGCINTLNARVCAR